MTQDEADKELGRMVREALARSIHCASGYEIDVAMDVAGIGYILARIHADIVGKYI